MRLRVTGDVNGQPILLKPIAIEFAGARPSPHMVVQVRRASAGWEDIVE